MHLKSSRKYTASNNVNDLLNYISWLLCDLIVFSFLLMFFYSSVTFIAVVAIVSYVIVLILFLTEHLPYVMKYVLIYFFISVASY